MPPRRPQDFNAAAYVPPHLRNPAASARPPPIRPPIRPRPARSVVIPAIPDPVRDGWQEDVMDTASAASVAIMMQTQAAAANPDLPLTFEQVYPHHIERPPSPLLPTPPQPPPELLPQNKALYRNPPYASPDGPKSQQYTSYSECRFELVDDENQDNPEYNRDLDNPLFNPVMPPEIALDDFTAEELTVDNVQFETHEIRDSNGTLLASAVYQVTVNMPDTARSNLHHDVSSTFTCKNPSYRPHHLMTHKRIETYNSAQVSIIAVLPREFKSYRWAFGFTLYRVRATQRQVASSEVTTLAVDPHCTPQGIIASIPEDELYLMAAYDPNVAPGDRHLFACKTVEDLRDLFINDCEGSFMDPMTGYFLEDPVLLVGFTETFSIFSRQTLFRVNAARRQGGQLRADSTIPARTIPARRARVVTFNPLNAPFTNTRQPHPMVTHTAARQIEEMVKDHILLRWQTSLAAAKSKLHVEELEATAERHQKELAKVEDDFEVLRLQMGQSRVGVLEARREVGELKMRLALATGGGHRRSNSF